MKITVKKAAPDVFALSFDDTEVALEGGDIKNLLLQITKLLATDPEAVKSPEDRTREFLRHIKNADNVGLQKFLLVADHDDVLVLLKIAENDKALLRKFYGNMSERSRKIFVEDLVYQFKEGVPSAQVTAAVKRLIGVAGDLETEGTLVYENVVKR